MTTKSRFGATPVHLNQIIASAKKGDVSSFGILYIQNIQGVYDFIFAQVLDTVLAQDLAEETFVNLWNNLAEVSSAEDLELNVFKHAYQVLAKHNKEPRMPFIWLFPHKRQNLENQPHPTFPAQHPKLSQIIFLHNSSKFSFDQISRIIKTPVWLVNRLHRIALKKLCGLPDALCGSPQETLQGHFNQLPEPNLHRNFFILSMYRLTALLKAAQTQARLREWQQGSQAANKPRLKPQLAYRAITTTILVLAIFLGSTGVVSAAQDSFPGESLYRTKITLEDTQLKLTVSDYADLRLRTQFSNRRLDEINHLLKTKQYALLDIPVENLGSHLVAISHYSSENNLDTPELFQQINLLLLRTETQFKDIKKIEAGLPNPILAAINTTDSNLQSVFQSNPDFTYQPNLIPDDFSQSAQELEKDSNLVPAQAQQEDDPLEYLRSGDFPSPAADAPTDQEIEDGDETDPQDDDQPEKDDLDLDNDDDDKDDDRDDDDQDEDKEKVPKNPKKPIQTN